jgi:hypothetical protein
MKWTPVVQTLQNPFSSSNFKFQIEIFNVFSRHGQERKNQKGAQEK